MFHVERQASVTSEKLRRYAELVRESPHNLLSRSALEELDQRHIPECVRFAHRLPPGTRLLDVGSGGGLPGIVIAIERPELEVHLLEATRKKADFLTATGKELDVGLTVHNARAEDLARGPQRGRFDLVTARAVAPLVRLVTLCAPFLARDGSIHAIKGGRWEQEVIDAASVTAALGLRVRRTPADDPDLDPKVVVIGP
jgi:16S rRNA (guanine527-N7)-methyltransferase